MKISSKNRKNIASTIKYSFAVAPLETLALFVVYGFLAITPLIAGYLFKILLDKLVGVNLTFWIVVLPLLLYISFQAFSKFLHVFKWAVVEYIFRWKLQDKLWLSFHQRLFSLDISHFENSNTFNTILQARNNINWRPYQLMQNFGSLLGSSISFLASIVVAATFSLLIPLVIALSTIPRFLLNLKFGEARWSIFDEGAESNKKMWYLSWLVTNSENIKEMKVFKAKEKILNAMKEIQERFYSQNKTVTLKYGFSNFSTSIIELLAIAFVLITQVPKVIKGVITIGDFSFILTAVYTLSDAVSEILSNLSNVYEESLHVSYFFEVMNLKNKVARPKKPKIFKLKTLAPKVEFKSVTFKYNDQSPYVLNDVSFTIEPGENVALVGENGAGKTTIIKLLMRFYDPTKGKILINGEDIKNINLDWWYDQVGTLFQDFIHYNFSVKESICLKDRGIDLNKIKKATKLSGADSFIRKFPRKYDQMLGIGFEEGKELSGGQWQKIALARAFYKMPHLLVLDEPTSAIDAQAEYEIFKNINRIYKDEKSLLIVSHRFSTVRNAEKILVIENGKITEEGNHQQLLKQNGKYAKMFKIQAKGYK